MASSSHTPDCQNLPFRGVQNDDAAFLPLNPELREIRCVILLPGSGDDPITCELVYTNIDKDCDTRIPYVALSYCWGDVEDPAEITLYGPSTKSAGACQEPISAPFRVTRNLHIALHALRNESRQCLWIDALCINQQDPREKTHQVQLMGTIYSSAESVLVWLGPENVYSRFLLRAWTAHAYPLEKNLEAEEMQKFSDEIADSTHPLWANMAQDKVLNQLALDFGDHEINNAAPDRYKIATSISGKNLFSRPWWRRIWVVQEVLLAPKREEGDRKVAFRIGQGKLDLQQMRQVIQLLYDIEYMPRDYRIATLKKTSWIFWFDLLTGDKKILDYGISWLLTFTTTFYASDPRDKLFALLLIASDTRDCFGQEPLIMPDYTKSPKEVFDDLVRWKPDIKGNVILVEGIGSVELNGNSDWSKREE